MARSKLTKRERAALLRDLKRCLDDILNRAFNERDANAVWALGEIAQGCPKLWPTVVDAVARSRTAD